MVHARHTALIGIAAVALLAGCAQTPAAPSAAPAATETPSASASPSATPTPSSRPTASASPAASATPTASASTEWPRCADGVVVSQHLASLVSWGGSYEEQVERSQPRAGFEPADLLASDGVLCSVIDREPVDGDPAVATVSTAIVRDAELPDAVAAWAAEHDYALMGENAGHAEYSSDPDPSDGVLDKVQLLPLQDPIFLDAYRQDSGLDLQPTDMVLMHLHIEAQG